MNKTSASDSNARQTVIRRSTILDGDDEDPMLSVINLVDVFLVVIGVLLIVVIQDPLGRFVDDNVTIIRNEGKPNMEIIVKDGQKITRFQSVGTSVEGDGEKAGTAYRLKDGSMVYVPAATEE